VCAEHRRTILNTFLNGLSLACNYCLFQLFVGMAKLYANSGSTFTATFTCKDSAGSVVNLTGHTARAMLRPEVSSATLTLNMAPTIPTPANGVISITITDEVTATIDAGLYYWDLVLDKAFDGSVQHLVSGTLNIKQQVTR